MSNQTNIVPSHEDKIINIARLRHLDSLGLNLNNKTVLEIGAGKGQLTGFFESLKCTILSTDKTCSAIDGIRQRFSYRSVEVLDLEVISDLSYLGKFDIVFCYGTLHRLKNPVEVLRSLAQVCQGLLLLETCVTLGDDFNIHLIPEDKTNPNQAFSGVGCRPTRSWIMQQLETNFGHAYISRYQPCHPDFTLDWKNSSSFKKKLHRSIFVGSRVLIENEKLSPILLDRQSHDPSCHKVWLDVGAHLGQTTLQSAANDPLLSVYAFEPNLEIASQLFQQAPNYYVIPVAIAIKNGISQFYLNEFEAASSLRSFNPNMLEKWVGGEVLKIASSFPVPTLRLDTVLTALELKQVEYLKIDAQGADFEVIQSLGDRIQDCLKIQVEVATTPDQLYLGATPRTEFIQYLMQRNFLLVEAHAQSHQQEENLIFLHKNALWMEPELRQKILQLAPADLLAIAETLATHHPLQPYPGWHFNIDWNKSDLQLQIRRSIWEYFNQNSSETSIIFNWINNLSLRLHLNNDFSSQLFVTGTYEPNELYYFSQYLAPGMTVLDIGANEGLYTLLAASVIQNDGLVVAFEPSPRELQRLQANLDLNQTKADMAPVKVLPIAISDRNGNHALKLAESTHSGQNTLGEFTYQIDCEAVVEVEVRRLDDLMPELKLASIDVIKMDIEGAEYAALQGAKQTLEQFHPLLLLEVIDDALQKQQSSADQVLQFLHSLGYHVFYYGAQTATLLKLMPGMTLNCNVIAIHPERKEKYLQQIDVLNNLEMELKATQIQLEQALTQIQNTAQFKETMHYQCDHLTRQTTHLESVKDELEAQLKAEQIQRQSLQAQAHNQHAQIVELQTVVETYRSHMEAMSNRVAAMESSKFWQIRTAWMRLKERISRRKDG